MKRIDDLFNHLTMYRVVLYYLIFLLCTAAVLSLTGFLAYNIFSLAVSFVFLLVVCCSTNKLFARAFHVPANAESVYISALILTLIIDPIRSVDDLWLLAWAAILAMGSKYMVAVKHKHIFNPVAFAVTVTYLAINGTATWWVGTASMMPFVLVGGLLMQRRLGRFDLVLSFFLSAFALLLMADLLTLGNLLTDLLKTMSYSPVLFFAFIILTEPLTAPPTRRLRIIYGALMGILTSPHFHIGSLYLTPEMAMLIGNLLSYFVSPKTRVALKLKEKIKLAPDVYDFVFTPSRRFNYIAGQYMEWTLGHSNADNRGNRRYFTLASAPGENTIRMGIKFYERCSSFKTALLALEKGDEIIAAQVAGDFVLPMNCQQKCIFIAGGVGITPFRSMIRHLLHKKQKRPITLFFANKNADEIVYKDVFDRAEQELGIRTIYTITDQNNIPDTWAGGVGRIDAEMVKSVVPDYHQCLFYISGPKNMVDGFKETLRQMNIPERQVKTDFFPGLS